MEEDDIGNGYIDEKLALAPVLDMLNHSPEAKVQ